MKKEKEIPLKKLYIIINSININNSSSNLFFSVEKHL